MLRSTYLWLLKAGCIILVGPAAGLPPFIISAHKKTTYKKVI